MAGEKTLANRVKQIRVQIEAAGIVDPARVTRFALQNAASVAGLLMTTAAMIAGLPPKKKSR